MKGKKIHPSCKFKCLLVINEPVAVILLCMTYLLFLWSDHNYHSPMLPAVIDCWHWVKILATKLAERVAYLATNVMVSHTASCNWSKVKVSVTYVKISAYNVSQLHVSLQAVLKSVIFSWLSSPNCIWKILSLEPCSDLFPTFKFQLNLKDFYI